MSPNNHDIIYRPAQTEDIPFILDSWLKSWRVCDAAGTIRNDLYYATQRATIEGLIGRGAEFIVASPTNKPEHILGWVCYEHNPEFALVHYLYVKDPYVRLGLQAELVERVPGPRPGAFTHRYRQVLETCKGWRHIPEIARRK